MGRRTVWNGVTIGKRGENRESGSKNGKERKETGRKREGNGTKGKMAGCKR